MSNPKTDTTLLSNPQEAFQTLASGGNLFIISVLDEVSLGKDTDIGDDLTAYDHVYLYGQGCLLSQSVKLKNSLFSLQSLTTTGPGLFDLSGKPGTSPDPPNQNPNEKGQPGGSGEPGGTFRLYLQNVADNRLNFKVSVAGGAGGDGQQGKINTDGGDGGDGGNGGTAEVLVGLSCCNLLDSLRAVAGLDNLARRHVALTPIIGAYKADTQWASLIPLLTKAARAKSLDDSTRALQAVADELASMDSQFDNTLHGNLVVNGGIYGTYGQGKTPGTNGSPGSPGSKSLFTFGRLSQLDWETGHTAPGFFVHPSQVSRLMDKARLTYWTMDPVGRPQSVTDTMVLFQQIEEKTAPFADATPENKALRSYYTAHETEYGALGSVQQLQSLHAQAVNALLQIKQGQDLFGFAADHVPLVSFDSLFETLDELMANFSLIQAAYDDYFAKLKEKKTEIASVVTTRQKNEALISNAKSQIRMLKVLLIKQAGVIDSYQSILPTLKKKVTDLLKTFETKVKDHFDFNFDSFLQNMSMVAFAPESKFMALTQGAEFLHNSLSKVTDSRGIAVNKDYLVDEIQTVQSSVKGLQEGYEALNDGTLKPDDPGGAKLMAEEQQFQTFFNDFKGQFPDDLKELKKAFDAYVQKVQERNNHILQYNAQVIVALKNHQLIDSLTAEDATYTAKVLSTMAPSLPDMVSFMSRSYYTARQQIMEFMDLTQQAYRFWALSDAEIISSTFSGNLPTLNASALLAAKSDLLAKTDKALEHFGSNAQHFPDKPDEKGLMVEVGQAERSVLPYLNLMTISLAAPSLTTGKANSVFAGMCDVRISRVRLWLDGVKTDSETLSIHITHTGGEEIYDQANNRFTFTHEPVTKLFTYNLTTKKIFEDANFGVEQNADQGTSEYAALGPFTQWQFKIDPDLNPGLDLSGLSAARIEFHGTNYVFA
ncbi:hypothetical protein [Desulfoluna spongiiphila]|uniref:hypothetical protein n=1 Tax=Desulfoluna spongiiphila TaxID=419481 RepID=UPI0012529B9E|nr:hypothetical protein [Desulfoluna spongiiphila]VVS94994.1 consensus disorder prediction [Desulfoluna spongiiphila]